MLKMNPPVPRVSLVVGAIISAMIILAVAQTSQAQTDYGRITIQLDVSMPDITVTLTAGSSNVRKCKTGVEGICVFAALDPDNYEVQVLDENKPIAKPIVVRLMSGQSVVRMVRLIGFESLKALEAPNVGQEPVSPPPIVNSKQLVERIIPGRPGERVTLEQMEELPNRNQTEAPLVETQTGVFNTGNDTFGGFIFNGQPGNQNVLREGGVSSNIVLSSASFQDTNALFISVKDRQSIKAYKSFALDTSNTPAKFGTGTGGQLVKDIQSGGSKFSGEVYEYFANDALSARNFFDFARKPSLRFNLFGINLAGPLNDKVLAFFNYEGIRASSGNTQFAAAPKLSLVSRAVPAVAPLLSSFRASGATVVTDASKDPDFDIIRLEAKNVAERNGITTRIDYQVSPSDELGFIYLGSRSREDIPEGASGRRNVSVDISHRGVLNYERVLTKDAGGNAKLNNQFIFGVIKEPAQVFGRFDNGGAPDLSRFAISLGGTVPQTGIEGQPDPMAVPTSGGLLRGDFDGRHLRFIPWNFSFIDQITWAHRNHNFTFGGELRLIRSTLDRLFGTTYKFANLTDFLANRANVEHTGDLGSFTASTGERRVSQEYYIAYLQDAWKIRSNFLLTFGLRYEYYTPLREAQNRTVNLDLVTGALLPTTNDLYSTRKTNFLPRIAFAWAPNWNGNQSEIKYGPNVFSGGFGMHVGPDVFDNILRPITNDRLRVKAEALVFPADPAAVIAASNPADREFTPVILSRDYKSPQLVYKFDFTFKRELIRRETQGTSSDDDEAVTREMFLTLSYVGSRSRNLLLRNFDNRITSVQTNDDPTQLANVRREFDIERGGELLQPFGELEFLTTGGRSSYDSVQASLKSRLKKYLRLFQAEYTLARNRGNTNGDEAITAGHPMNFDYDFGYIAGDVRHKFTFVALLAAPCRSPGDCTMFENRFLKWALAGWTFATLGTFQTGVPIDLRINRPDVVYLDQAGNVFSRPAAGRRAVLNVPGGGSSIAAYRPDLVPGVSPYLRDDRRLLNPAAFSIPAPGTLGNLSRGALRGPGVRLIDLSIRKEVLFVGEKRTTTLTFNVDFTNLFNFTNFRLPAATLPNLLGTDVSEHQLQPGQPFSEEGAGTFGVMTRTFKRKSDLGSSRQIQFGLSLKF